MSGIHKYSLSHTFTNRSIYIKTWQKYNQWDLWCTISSFKKILILSKWRNKDGPTCKTVSDVNLWIYFFTHPSDKCFICSWNMSYISPVIVFTLKIELQQKNIQYRVPVLERHNLLKEPSKLLNLQDSPLASGSSWMTGGHMQEQRL